MTGLGMMCRILGMIYHLLRSITGIAHGSMVRGDCFGSDQFETFIALTFYASIPMPDRITFFGCFPVYGWFLSSGVSPSCVVLHVYPSGGSRLH